MSAPAPQGPRLLSEVVNFDQTYLSSVPRLGMPAGKSATAIMAILNKDKHKDYIRYAEHCLGMAPAATDQDSRTVQR